MDAYKRTRRLVASIGPRRATVLVVGHAVIMSVLITLAVCLIKGLPFFPALTLAAAIPLLLATPVAALLLRTIAELNAREAELRDLARTDDLTGLLNRRRFFELGEQAAEQAHRYDRWLSVVIFDIDDFKAINDSRGHAVGDQVLRAFADLCRDTVRTVDALGRIGGEEFAVIMPETDLDAAHAAAERLRSAVEAGTRDRGRCPVPVTASFGIVAGCGEAADFAQMMVAADMALYKAKDSGKNRVAAGRLRAQSEPA